MSSGPLKIPRRTARRGRGRNRPLRNTFAAAKSTRVVETYIPNPIGTIAEAALPAGVKLGPHAAGASIPARKRIGSLLPPGLLVAPGGFIGKNRHLSGLVRIRVRYPARMDSHEAFVALNLIEGVRPVRDPLLVRTFGDAPPFSPPQITAPRVRNIGDKPPPRLPAGKGALISPEK